MYIELNQRSLEEENVGGDGCGGRMGLGRGMGRTREKVASNRRFEG